jgi:hypothetical protein
MAGEWIKFESVTPDKPEVFQMADRLGIDPDAVVGKLVRVWVWADQQTIDGNARGVTRALLDRLTSAAGFADALISVGWLLETDAGLTFPRFDDHNGKTAKARALGAKRAAVARSSRSERDGSVTAALPREEKRREEKKITPSPPAELVDVEGVGPAILTETPSGGGGDLISNEEPKPATTTEEPTAEDWAELVGELTFHGLTMSAEAVRFARKHGATPAHCHAVVDYWRSHPGAWSIGIIYSRFKDPDLCKLAPAAGWPTPAARVITTNGDNAARERQADQVAEIDASKKRAAESNAELDELAAEHGDALDQLGDDDRAALLPAGPFRETLNRRGWRTPTIRGRVLRAYVDKYLGEPVEVEL